MKTKAPEKIYLQENTTTDCYGEFWPEWFEARGKDTDVEYVRTDAFIEKVGGWLKDCATFTDMNGKKRIDKEMYKATVEDFKKYMERNKV